MIRTLSALSAVIVSSGMPAFADDHSEDVLGTVGDWLDKIVLAP